MGRQLRVCEDNCRLEADQDVSAEELIRFVGSRIAGYKKPHLVEFVTDLPLLADGSPDREKVKQMYKE